MKKITIKNNVKIIDDVSVIKKEKKDLINTYKYLLSRSFDYFPKVLKQEEDEYYYKYLTDIEEPREEKILDLMNLLSLLHSKTTFFKEVDIDYYKEIYERILNQIEDVYSYYNNLFNIINSVVYMSPSNYLIARNITIIYSSLEYAKKYINIWYKQVENIRKIRVVTIHNNLSLEHYIKEDKPYLISWSNSKIDIPLYDIISVYKNHYLEFNFEEILQIYFDKYPYTTEEMILFLVLISIPDKIKYDKKEYNTVINIRNIIDYIYKSSQIVKKYGLKEEDIEKQKDE